MANHSKGGRKPKYDPEIVADAITKSQGVLAAAAVALKCSRATVQNYVNKYATVKKAYEEANETTIDFVEQQLLKAIREGNITAMIFFLKTKAKHRGYVERQEMAGPDGGPVVVEQKIVEVVKNYGGAGEK